MINYKTNLLYFSPSGTTKSVLYGIAKGIGLDILEHDLTVPKNRKSILNYGKNDLLILGLPVYSGRIPEITESVIKKISGDGTPAIIVAVYGNRDFDDALLEMKDILNDRGFNTIAGAAFIGEHSFTDKVAGGRPDSKDIKMANEFGKDILNLLEEKDHTYMKLDVPGNYPYRERKPSQPLGPTIDENCTLCGKCVENCPVEALSKKEKIEVNESLCIRCNRCRINCPENAIYFGGFVTKAKDFLIENCSKRKEPKIFLK